MPKIVKTEKVFAGVMFWPMLEPMNFFEYTARPAAPTLDAIAAPKPSHVNDSSFALARLTPPITGISD
eukprot:CAMPEP_0172902086 /NCGR_PEP_ID=MMETSP1075-20121228/167692_1 /TAXON_ID=2916 /ORGANISM="Ceratium fusus, Strain PA161109" /LENGTH=67 /DNA_ID=CAMNT_0013758617 /DNA_START=276 /DNA_END=476 /DNA_ORIENTATION=-